MELSSSEESARLEANLSELVAAVAGSPNLEVRRSLVTSTSVVAEVALDTTSLTRGSGGLDVSPSEIIYLSVDERFPSSLGHCWVEHHRWLGFPHLLLGQQLCLYLDAQSEWDPSAGAIGFVGRVREWFRQAVGGEFDPTAALYHPVGGIPYETPGASTLVVRQPITYIGEPHPFEARRITLSQRSPFRVDVAAWSRTPKSPETQLGLLVVLNNMIPLRVLRKLSSLVVEIGEQGSRKDRRQFVRKLRQVSRTLDSNQPLRVVIAVPNPARLGEVGLHLLAAEVAPEEVQKAIGAAERTKVHAPDLGVAEPDITWLHVDDTRSSLHTRRDADRPMTAFADKDIELWGCGALGSWLGELLVRAGVARLTLSDPGRVTTGLLVRQNYREEDIGRPKAEALADRLRSINDRTVIECHVGPARLDEAGSADLIIDATVNTLVARALNFRQEQGLLASPVAQVATDNETSSLGILTICDPRSSGTTNDVDDALRLVCSEQSELGAFSTFWDYDELPPITPTPGCSIPTFRGSGADAAAVAACALNLLATPFERGGTGGFVFGLNHSLLAPGIVRSIHLE